jgi:transposase-like protein
LQEASERLFSYFQFARLHCKSIDSTNVIESTSAAVKLRIDAAWRISPLRFCSVLRLQALKQSTAAMEKIHGYKLVAQTIEQLQTTRNSKLRIAA